MVKKHGKGGWKFPFLKIANDLKEAVIFFGNLEEPISERERKVGLIYSLRVDLEEIEGLKF